MEFRNVFESKRCIGMVVIRAKKYIYQVVTACLIHSLNVRYWQQQSVDGVLNMSCT